MSQTRNQLVYAPREGDFATVRKRASMLVEKIEHRVLYSRLGQVHVRRKQEIHQARDIVDAQEALPEWIVPMPDDGCYLDAYRTVVFADPGGILVSPMVLFNEPLQDTPMDIPVPLGPKGECQGLHRGNARPVARFNRAIA